MNLMIINEENLEPAANELKLKNFRNIVQKL